MPKPAQRYDIYLPLRYNDGREIENEKFLQLAVHEVTAERSEHDELIGRFGGVTSIKQKSQSEQFFVEYKEQLKKRFEQLDVLILAQTVIVI